MSENSFKVPEEVAEIHDEYESMVECRDIAIKKVFGWKRAAYFGKQSVKKRREFWQAITEVYPELSGKELAYSPDTKTVTVDK